METTLEDTNFVFVDCQTTGGSPATGSVIELAWCQASAKSIEASDNLNVNFRLVELPVDTVLPKRISRITGISDLNLQECVRWFGRQL